MKRLLLLALLSLALLAGCDFLMPVPPTPPCPLPKRCPLKDCPLRHRLCPQLVRGARDLVAFTASWCAPCQRNKPALAQLEKQGVQIHHIDVDSHRDLADQYRIRAVPTYVIRENAREVKRTSDIQVLLGLREWLCSQ